MNGKIFMPLFALVMATSCGEEEKRLEIHQPTTADYSGVFRVSFSRVANTCTSPVGPPAPTVQIRITGTNIQFGNIPGHWDGASQSGNGYNRYCRDTGNECTVCSGISYNIAFSGYYHFVDSFNTAYSYSPACGGSQCFVNDTRIGTRVHNELNY